MNPTTASFNRYWEPNYLQATSISLIAGTIASFVTYPCEYLKTVIQHQATGVGFRGRYFQGQGYNPFQMLRLISQTGRGFGAVFDGFDAHLLGRLSYLFSRNTLYLAIYNQVKPKKAFNDLTYREKSVIGAIAGAFGAFVSHPFSVLSIRQILDIQVKPEWRRNYSNSVSEALNQLKASGESYQGLKVNILRHIVYNMTLTGPYDYFKEGFFTRFGEYGFVNPLALIIASFIGAMATLPFDNLRTRYVQNFKEAERNRMNWRDVSHLYKLIVATERHPMSLWAGFYTYYTGFFLYAWLTVGITNTFTDSWKRKQGLLEWQMM